jgi:FtsZ-binding cell division protein ZapB
METTASHASGDVIKLLATEIDRLSAQNTKLAEIVNKLQLEIIQLRTENADLAGYMRRHGYGQQDNKAADKSG